MDDARAALLGDHEAAKRLTEAGVLAPCPWCGKMVVHAGTISPWMPAPCQRTRSAPGTTPQSRTASISRGTALCGAIRHMDERLGNGLKKPIIRRKKGRQL